VRDRLEQRHPLADVGRHDLEVLVHEGVGEQRCVRVLARLALEEDEDVAEVGGRVSDAASVEVDEPGAVLRNVHLPHVEVAVDERRRVLVRGLDARRFAQDLVDGRAQLGTAVVQHLRRGWQRRR
jgi:hypothetical protein